MDNMSFLRSQKSVPDQAIKYMVFDVPRYLVLRLVDDVHSIRMLSTRHKHVPRP